jgi:predicted membrane protein
MRKRNSASIILGFFLVLFGLSMLFDNLNLFGYTGVIWKLWPTILLYFGVKKLINAKWFSGSFLFIVGIAFLVDNFDLYKYDSMAVIWPLLIIMIGLNVFFKAFKPASIKNDEPEDIFNDAISSKDKTINELTIFSSNKRQYTTLDFKGGSSVTIFGETVLDLSKSKITKSNASIEIVTLFGETKVIVPEGMNIRMTSVPILGVAEDQRKTSDFDETGSNLLYIKAVSILGGIKLINS